MEFAKENAYRNLGDPKVHLSFILDTSGMVSLIKAEATYDLPPPPPEELGEQEPTADESPSTEAASSNSTGDEVPEDSASETSGDKAKKDPKKDSKKKSSKKSKPVADLVIRKTLKIVENVDQVVPHTWSPAMIAESRAKLNDLTLKDNERKANEGKHNHSHRLTIIMATFIQSCPQRAGGLHLQGKEHLCRGRRRD